ARWHPKEKKIVFINDAPGNYQIFSTEIKKEEVITPTQLTKTKNRSTDPRYLRDGTIVFQRDEGGNENFQIFILDEMQNEYQITKDSRAKHIITSTSENYLYFRANIDNKARFDVYRVRIPIKENSFEKIYEPKEGIPYAVFSDDDKQIVVQLAYGNMHQEIILLDTKLKTETSLTFPISKDDEVRWNAIRWINNNHLLVGTDYQSDIRILGLISIDGNFTPIKNIEEKYELSSATWSKESPFTFVSFNEDGYSALYKARFDSTGVIECERIMLPFKGVISSGDTRSFTQAMAISNDATLLAITITSSNNPFNIWILDIENNKFWRATRGDTAGIEGKSFIDSMLERFESFDGFQVPYFKHVPSGGKPEKGWPTILIIHGGPEAQFVPAFSPVIQLFLSAGYSIIAPNIRGSAGYGRKYLDLDNKEKRLDSIKDIKNLAIHLKNDPDIDGEKLVVYGGSYGGFAVLSAMTEHPEIWAAGIDIVGISNFVTFLQNTAPWRRKLREVEYGSLEEDLEMLKSISPIHKVDKISSPLFIIHGDNDERVPLSEAIQIHKILKEKGLNVELLRFDDEGHGITKLKNKAKAYSGIIEWLSKVVY
ncbi:MAG: S9 family peptidase, partial [Candidatus Heimdallarchaeota archaeon]|nr:S9 family peptidase [Candidatus Heimdallarchaeota archaeon]MCK4876243.1 S9 family peptidase [Candidatus Heimdallarchaeota archaeon]